MIEKVNTPLRVSTFSRRQFLKRTTIVAAGAAISAIAISAGCKPAGVITSKPPESTTSTKPDLTSDTTNPTTTNSTIKTITTPPTASTITTTATTSTITGLPITSYAYTPPTVLPPLLNVLNSTCVVATDRSYTPDHIWVKTVSNNIVVLGITTTLIEILYNPYKITLDKANSQVTRHEPFGSMEGFKMVADLLSPVSGKILQVNGAIVKASDEGKLLDAIIKDPYNSGWMVVVQLSKPDELGLLMTAQNYRDSISSVGDV